MLYWYIHLKYSLREQSGQSMYEYAMILGLVLVATVGAVTILGGDILDLYNGVDQGMDISFQAKTWFNG